VINIVAITKNLAIQLDLLYVWSFPLKAKHANSRIKCNDQKIQNDKKDQAI